MPSVCEGILQSRARGLLELFQRKGLLPRTLNFLAALGDLDAVRAALHEHGDDFATVNEGFVRACSFKNETVASLLLERLIALDPQLGRHVDGSLGRPAFIKYFIETRAAAHAKAVGPWKASVMEQVSRAAHEGDVTTFVGVLRRESCLLEHGANINTNWNSHEPASILHHLVFLPNPYESMQFLVDRGIDMTIKDYRWNGNAAGWARVGNNDEKMAQWLEDEERRRDRGR